MEAIKKNEEKFYLLLEKLYYEYEIPVEKIMTYFIEQTGQVGNMKLMFEWGKYLDICKKHKIDNKTPKNFLYNYNMARELDGQKPIVFSVIDTGDADYFVREGNKIIVKGPFPCDEENNPCMKYIGVRVENGEYIKMIGKDNSIMEKILEIGLNSRTNVYILNIYNDEDETKNIWYPVYIGPSNAVFDSSMIKRSRTSLNMTQNEVAESIGVNIRTYQKWESGKNVPIACYLMKLMNLFDIKSEQWFIKSEPIYDKEIINDDYFFSIFGI